MSDPNVMFKGPEPILYRFFFLFQGTVATSLELAAIGYMEIICGYPYAWYPQHG